MPENNDLIVGFHRSRKLAERHARKINGKIVARRNSSGRFSKHGHWFTFERRPKELLRYTVGITFPFRKEYGSVLAQLYTAKWGKGSRSERAKRDKGAALEAATLQVEKLTKYPRERFWFDLEAATSTETETVPFDDKFSERLVVISELETDSETGSKTITYRRK